MHFSVRSAGARDYIALAEELLTRDGKAAA